MKNTIEAQEKQEAQELRQRILDASKTVPRSVVEGSHNKAVAFKKDIAKALKVAHGPVTLGRMRDGWNIISSYYRN